MAELQKDPITRSDFLSFGILGAITGAILTIPPVAFVLSPVIKTDVLGQSNVDEGWQEVGPVAEVPKDEPKVFVVDFPIEQTYGDRDIQERFPDTGRSDKQFVVRNAVWLSWKHEVLQEGRQGSGGDELGEALRPDFLDEKTEGFTEEERRQIEENLNVLSNSCAHLGCPVRWVEIEGHGEFLCPCHGGIYDINGGYVGGPPPRGMFRYTKTQVRENGRLYIKHEFDIEDRFDAQQPYVI